MKIYLKESDGTNSGQGSVSDVSVVCGTKRESVAAAYAGDLVSVSVKSLLPRWTQSIVSSLTVPPIACKPVDPPTMAVRVSVNSSPFHGKEGKYTNNMQIGNRVKNEALTNVAIQVVESPQRDYFEIRGRGEMQFGVLLEMMRREGYELTLSPPIVLITEDENGQKMEPWEEVTVGLPSDVCSLLVDKIGNRQGDIKDIQTAGDKSVVKLEISARNFMGNVVVFFFSQIPVTTNTTKNCLDNFEIVVTKFCKISWKYIYQSILLIPA